MYGLAITLSVPIFPHIVSAETILFLTLEIQRSQYINVQNLFKGGNYMRKYAQGRHRE